MSDTTPGVASGVADLDQVTGPLCPGCARDGHADGHRNAMGRLRPGHTANVIGRPTGRLDDTTLAALALMKANAKQAVDIVVARMDDPNPWVALAASKTILACLPAPHDGQESPDTEWMHYATDEELDLILRIVDRAKARMDDPVIDVTPDAFTVETLPAPIVVEQPTPDEDAEEFGP